MGSEWVDFRAVKESVSLAEVLRGYGVDWLRSRRPDQLQGRCPIHRGSREDAFHVSLSKNAFQCFACQARGNVLDLVAAMEQCSLREAALRLARRYPDATGSHANLARLELPLRVFWKIPRNMAPASMRVTSQTESMSGEASENSPQAVCDAPGLGPQHPRPVETARGILGQTLIGVRH